MGARSRASCQWTCRPRLSNSSRPAGSLRHRRGRARPTPVDTGPTVSDLVYPQRAWPSTSTRRRLPLVVSGYLFGVVGRRGSSRRARLVYLEAAAALAQARRLGRISGRQVRDARSILDDLWSCFDVVELDGDLMTLAARIATEHGLRGYGATHCAAAVIANDDDLVAGSAAPACSRPGGHRGSRCATWLVSGHENGCRSGHLATGVRGMPMAP